LANQTTAAAIVTVANSKPTKAIIGNSTIALLRGRHHGYKMLAAGASCDRRMDRRKSRKKMVAHPVSLEPVSVVAVPF